MARRFKDAEFNLTNDAGKIETWEQVGIAALYDIRDELKELNRLLHCSNFQNIPRKLDRISFNTAKKRKRKATALNRGVAQMNPGCLENFGPVVQPIWKCDRCGKVDDTEGEPLCDWRHVEYDASGIVCRELPSGKMVRVCGGYFRRTMSDGVAKSD